MARLIAPFLHSAMRGEKKVAKFLAKYLPDHWRIWHNIPIAGSLDWRPDLILLAPDIGLWVLEIKDWKIGSIHHASADHWKFKRGGQTVAPLHQARRYAERLVDSLRQDRHLIGKAGQLLFPYAYGVCMTGMTQDDVAQFSQVLPSPLTLCSDDLQKEYASALPERLRGMFKVSRQCRLTPALITHLCAVLYPEIRLPQKNNNSPWLAMDAAQEELTRQTTPGHHVIHGVSGSGKTLILLARARQLLQEHHNILVLCFNKVLARWLQQQLTSVGITESRIKARTFHSWCRETLHENNIMLQKSNGEVDFGAAFTTLVQGFNQGSIAIKPYPAILVDEAQDFEPAWLQLLLRLLAPQGHWLMLLDIAQRVYARQILTLEDLGLNDTQVTNLTCNYRNAPQILSMAWRKLSPHLPAVSSSGLPLLTPVTATGVANGRTASPATLMDFSDFTTELAHLLHLLQDEHDQGRPWSDMAILYHHRISVDRLQAALQQQHIPYALLRDDPQAIGTDAISITTFHSSKGMEWPLVALPALGGQLIKSAEDAKLFYVAMTRATEKLIVGQSSL